MNNYLVFNFIFNIYYVKIRYNVKMSCGIIINIVLTRYGQSIFISLSIVLGTLDRPSLDAAGIVQMHKLPFYNLKGRGVLVGIVDTGVDYTLDVFRYADGTSKIQFILDQSVSSVPPEGF